HLGSFKDLGEKKGFAQLITGLEKSLEGYVGSAQLLIENSAGAGEIIGDTFEEIKAVISNPKLKKFRLGVCLDTCHAFASGYDMRGKAAVEKTLKSFEKIVGLQNLKAIHVNDSQTDLGSHRDRHEHIGRGKIGMTGFKALLGHPKLSKINLYLETEHDLVKEDIVALKTIRGQ
ncbi:MAG: deoxyribonuclease IV, partial [bacterium]|nr:deoxyribonuclease IV [bacterium]